MAQPVSFPEAGDTLVQPGAGVEALGLVCSLVGEDEDCATVSCWRLSFQEMAEICRTGVLWVKVRGISPPDFMVTGHKQEALGAR